MAEQMKLIQIDLKQILVARGLHLPGFIVSWVERLIRQEDLNGVLRATYPSTGSEFAEKTYEYFELGLEVEGLDKIPADGRYVFASNHPLGGLDGIGLILALGKRFGDARIAFLVNDLLMNVEPLRPVFLPINKFGAQGRESARVINEAYASEEKQILVFPAGLVSRLQPSGEIADLPWQKSFVAKALESGRDIVPVTFVGQNRPKFYKLARWRKRLHIPFNLEQVMLPAEVVESRGKKFKAIFHEPIAHATLKQWRAEGKSYEEIAAKIRLRLRL